MSVTDELLTNTERYAADFHRGGLPLPPGKRVVVPVKTGVLGEVSAT